MQRKRILIVVVISLSCLTGYSQPADSTGRISHFNGSFGITNNGISLIPTFSVNRPAGIILLSMGRNKFSFEPDLRFTLSGKPWSFLFWFRYQAAKSDKFSLRLGIHPALNFRTENVTISGGVREQLIARRYLAAEIVPHYHFNKKISVGLYYLNGHGFDKGGVKYSHFLTVNSNFSHIPLSGHINFSFNPQLYYLRLEKDEGWFATATLGLFKKDFPFSLSAIFNKELQKGIPGARDFIWNVTLTYSFGKNYITK